MPSRSVRHNLTEIVPRETFLEFLRRNSKSLIRRREKLKLKNGTRIISFETRRESNRDNKEIIKKRRGEGKKTDKDEPNSLCNAWREACPGSLTDFTAGLRGNERIRNESLPFREFYAVKPRPTTISASISRRKRNELPDTRPDIGPREEREKD